MNSPRKVPPSRRSSTQGQLLDELEALSQALYKAQAQQKVSDQHAHDPLEGLEGESSPVFAKKPLARRETLPARRFSSYEPSKDASAIPLPSLAASLSTPVPSAHPPSRHSISTGHMATASFDSKPAAATSRPRFTSTTLPSQPLSSWGEEVSDIRSRIEKRGAPQLQQLRSPDRFHSEEYDWLDDSPDVSSKLEPASGDKKKSFWNWKPLRAISHIGRQRYYCVFSAYVHAAKGLPPAMNGLRLCVHVRKEETKEGAVQTIPSRVFQGVAEFEETLYMKCSVYGSKGPSNTVKFMSRAFIVSVVAPDVEELELGKHQLDLSRLLPENMDDIRGETETGNSWNTSLELSGKAKGGKLVITFNYEFLDKDMVKSSSMGSKFQGSSARRGSSLQTSYSLPNSAHGTPRTRTANAYANLSPSVSEPGNDFKDDLGMDLLNLDDPTEEVKGAPQQAEVQYYPSINSQLGTPAGTTVDPYNAFDNFEPRLKASSSLSDQELAPSTLGPSVNRGGELSDVDDYASENEQDFMVVDKGMEIDEAVNVFTDDKESGPNGLGMDATLEGTKSPQQGPVQQEEVPVGRSPTAGNDAPEVEKKETVTYQMVMKTLESLLQGTSAKERAHLDMVEGQPESETLLEESGGYRAGTKQARRAVPLKNLKDLDNAGVEGPKGSKEEAEERIADDGLDQEVNEFLHMLEAGDHLSDGEGDSPRAQLLKQFEQEAGGFGLELGPSKDAPTSIDNTSPGPGVPLMGAWSTSSTRQSVPMAPESKPFRTTHGSRNKIKESPGEAADWRERSLQKNTAKPPEPPPLGKGLGASITVKDGGTLRSMNPTLFQSESCTGKLVMQVSKPVVLPAEIGSGTVDVLRNMASMGIENMALQAMTAMPLEELMGTSIEQIALEGLAAGKVFRIRGALGGPFRLRSTLKQGAKPCQQVSTDNKDAYVSLENLALTAMQQLEYLAMDGLKIQAGMTDEEAPYALNAFSLEGQGGGDGSPGNIGALKGVTGVHLLKGAKVPAQTAGGAKGLMDMAITLDEWMLLDAGSYSEAENSKDAIAIMAAHGAVKDVKTVDDKGEGPRWGCMGNTLSIAMLVQLRDPLRSFEPIGVPMIAFVQGERVVMPTGRDGETESLFKITGIHMAGLRASPESRRPGWGSQRQLRAATRWLLANGMSRPKAAMTGKSREALWSISAQLLGSRDKWKDLARYNSHVRNPDILYEHQSLLTR